MCDCKSYNQPSLGGTMEEVVLDPRPYIEGTTKTVCVDSCISDDIIALWSAGIKTAHSCCGHNIDCASIVIVNPNEFGAAADILRSRSDRKFRLFTYVH